MAKYTFYLDMWPGRNPEIHGLDARTKPFLKPEKAKRWAFDVVIPDDVQHDVDAHAAEVSKPRLVESE